MADDQRLADALIARQKAQQAQVLPTERQPPYPGNFNPQEEALQSPLVSPEDLVGGAIASKVAAPLMKGGAALLADEAGVLKLGKQAASELNPSELPRQMRAIDMGFDPTKTYYHGTSSDFKGFKLTSDPKNGAVMGQGVYLSEDPDVASGYATRSGNSGGYGTYITYPEVQNEAHRLYPEHRSLAGDELLEAIKNTQGKNDQYKNLMSFADSQAKAGGNVLPVHVSTKNTFNVDGPADPKVIRLLKKELPEDLKGILDKKESNLDILDIMTGRLPAYRVTQLLEDAGYDSVKSADVHVVFDPKNIRSKFAEFDPAKASSSNLSAGVAGAIGAGGLAASSQKYAEGGEIEQPDLAPMPPSAAINLVNPEGQLVSVPQEHLQTALETGYSQPSAEHVAAHFQQEDYGSAGQQALAGLEGVAQGVAGPVATGLERLAGVSPEGMRGREEANPYTHGVGELAGFAGSAVLGTGEAALLGKAGEAAAAASGLGKAGSRFVQQVGADAVKAAFETALYQGGDELSRKFKEDPEQTAGSALAHIGLSGVMGGVFGGALGAALRKTGILNEAATQGAASIPEAGVATEGAKELYPGVFVSELDRPALAAGDFKATIDHTENLTPKQKEGIFAGLKERKSNAPAIEAFAEENQLPIHPGMISASKDVQKITSGLIEGAPTYSGQATKAIYDAGYKGASGIVEGALGQGSQLSKAEIGQRFQQGLASQIKEENAPIAAMYERLKMHNEFIPLHQDTGRIVKELESMPEFRLAGHLPGGNLVKGAIDGIGKAQTVDDLKFIRSSINGSLGPTAAPSERRVAAIVGDKLKQLEEDSIETFAKHVAQTPEDIAVANGLNAARKQADAIYKPFIQKLQKLSKALGKENIGGTQGAIDFINRLTPEQVTDRLFSKNNSQFLKFFEKEFPEQSALMRDYQKGALREAATKEGVLSPQRLFTSIDKLEPEIQRGIFTKEELSKLSGAKEYLQSFPKNYNPSNTSNMGALREFFTSPVKVASANARDLAMDKFIQTFGANPRAQQAAELGRATVNGEKLADKGVKAVLGTGEVPPSLKPTEAHRSKLSKLVDTYHGDPSRMLSTGDNNPVPAYAQAFATMAARAVQYLSTLKPPTQPKTPLDTKPEPSPTQKATYHRALDIAQQPLNVLHRMKEGTLTAQDVTTLKTIYPSVYNGLAQKLNNSIIDKTNHGEIIPYQQRLQLSLFLGQPMDSTMTQATLASLQAHAQAVRQQMTAPRPPSASSVKGLSKLSLQAQTPGQARLADRSDGKL